jgi:hypothetical protein
VLAGDVADQEEAKAGPLYFCHRTAGDAVEAFEDALQLILGNADAGVGDAEGHPGVAGNGQRAADVHAFGGVLDGVVENVDDSGAEVFGDAEGMEGDGAGGGFEDDALRGKMMALEGDGDAVGDEGFEVDDGSVLLTVALT